MNTVTYVGFVSPNKIADYEFDTVVGVPATSADGDNDAISIGIGSGSIGDGPGAADGDNDAISIIIGYNDIVEIADALGDMLYILCGTILEHGLQHKMEAVFDGNSK